MSGSYPPRFQDQPQRDGPTYDPAFAGQNQQEYNQRPLDSQQNSVQYSPQVSSAMPQSSPQNLSGSMPSQGEWQGYEWQQNQSGAANSYETSQRQGNYYQPVIDHTRDYTPSIAAHQPAALAWDPQTMSPYADPDFDPNAPVDPNAPEGERSLRHAVIGGTTGYIVGHKTGHGGIGALLGAVAGDFLSDKRHDLKHHIREDWGNPSNQSSSQSHSTSGYGSHDSDRHHHHHHHHNQD